MALNLFGYDLKVDGKIGSLTRDTWNQWSISFLDEPLSDDIGHDWMKLMVKVPLAKG
jgi:hypothetical protein